MSNAKLDRWDLLTGVPVFDLDLPEVRRAIEYQSSCGIGEHPFMALLSTSKDAIRLWAVQEYLISVRFAQDLAYWLSSIQNCHVRAMVLPVFTGEHGPVKDGRADAAHAKLAADALISLRIDFNKLRAAPPTEAFLNAMRGASSRPMFGAGFLGIGNERLLVPEYSAILKNIEMQGPVDVPFRTFLMANISEDSWHASLMERAASGLASLDYEAQEFLDGAVAGVDARLEYYDALSLVAQSDDGFWSARC